MWANIAVPCLEYILTKNVQYLYKKRTMKRNILTEKDRTFFSQITRAAFSNPFSEERDTVDTAIADTYGKGLAEAAPDPVTGALSLRIAGLEKQGKADVCSYNEEDRYLIKTAIVFYFFHRYAERLDKLIIEQTAAGDTPCAVGFAGELLASLRRFGISDEDAARYLAGMYQLRRAFYFIREGLAGQCESMRRLKQELWRNIFTHDTRLYDEFLWNRMEDFSTLLLGDTGTGKGAAASAIGRSGFIPFDGKTGRFRESFTKTFIAINLSQFPESLIESELFGHRKGAFTGAIDSYEGILSRCSPCGSILLDEIGDAGIPVQIKLLQVLQERTYCPVGSHEKRRFAGRVIAATNRSIEELRKEKLFREDFYYRLCSDVIVMPTLHKRLAEDPGELDLLLRHTVNRMVGYDAPVMQAFVKERIRKCLPGDYHWPGNVRELEQCVRRIMLTGSYMADSSANNDDLEARIRDNITRQEYDADGLLTDYLALLYRRHGTYEEVARRVRMDRRTVKKYLDRKMQSSSQ